MIDKMFFRLILITIAIILLIISGIVTFNLVKDFGINNLGKSIAALYQVKINNVDYFEITENVYMAKNAEQSEKISHIRNNENPINFTSPAIFKANKNTFLYSIVEYFQGTTGILGPNIILRVNDLVAEDLFEEYTLSNEDSLFLYTLVANMKCRNYTCDGISDYHFKLDNNNYGIEVYNNEIHIIPYDYNIDDNEAIITSNNFIKLKQILDRYPQNSQI